MPAAGAWRDLMRGAIAASIALLGLWLLVGAVQAQTKPEPPQGPDHYYYQFFGYARDVTVDGQALQPGDSITPILNGEPVKAALIPANGFFLTFKHDFTKPPIGDCHVVYQIDSQRHEQPIVSEEFMYAKGCGDIEVKLALSTGDRAGEEAASDTEPGSSDSRGDTNQDNGQDQSEEDLMESQSDDDLMEQASTDRAVDQGEATQPGQPASEIRRPNAPRTGSGGLSPDPTETNWSVVAGALVLLTAIVVGAMVLMRRRNDQSPR